MDQIWNVIGQYAFPIVMCIIMAWYVKYREDQHTKERDTLNTLHRDEISKVTDAVNNNTIALTQLTDYMKAKDD